MRYIPLDALCFPRLSGLVVSAGLSLGVALGPAPRADAQLSTEDVIGLGIQLLLQSQQNQATPAPAPRSQNTQTRQSGQGQSPSRTARSQLVAETQRLLNALGYPAGPEDGAAGPQTRNAVALFQRDQGLPPTGTIDPALVTTLQSRLAAGGTAPAPSLAPSAAGMPGTLTILEGVDIPGSDYRSGLTDPMLLQTGVESCAWFCAQDAQCQAFTYNTAAEVCILKDAVGSSALYAAAVSGVKQGASAEASQGALDTPGPAVAPDFPTFVNMALMSDTETYLAAAGFVGVNYIRATGTEQQCKALYDAQRQDEFARREAIDQAAVVLQGVVARLEDQPRRVEVPIEATFGLAEYDFDRQGFPIKIARLQGAPILSPGIVALQTEERPVFCRTDWSYTGDFGAAAQVVDDFDDLGAEHGGVPGVDFLPMPQAEARLFRTGSNSVVMKATLVVEPREQGLGPLRGQIVALSAHDPVDDRLLHRWDVAASHSGDQSQAQDTDWSPELLASLVLPMLEPDMDDADLDNAAIEYFRRHEATIAMGNPPPESPLPVEEMRGRLAEVIVATNRKRLREALREKGPELPLAVELTQRVTPYFEEGRGIYFNQLEIGLTAGEGQDPLEGVVLSDRDLQLYDQLVTIPDFDSYMQAGFRAWVFAAQYRRVLVEFDRIIRLDPVSLSIEEAAARGLVGSSGSGLRDSILLRWSVDVTGVRKTPDAVILALALRGLSYEWQSDGSPVATFTPSAFQTVAEVRGAAEAALPPLASADTVAPPPAGSRWDAEMTDLLQLRFAPDTIDDRAMERMMLARFAYEASLTQGEPLWGRFFRNLEAYPTPEERSARFPEFRAWSEARARALPERLTLILPLRSGPDGMVAPFENVGLNDHDLSCREARERDPAQASESELVVAKLCAFLDAAWQSPDPLLRPELRFNCVDDAYCAAIYNARIAVNEPVRNDSDFIQVDQLPTMGAADLSAAGQPAIELEVEAISGSLEPGYPETLMQKAQAAAGDFAATYGAARVQHPDGTPDVPVMVFQAKAVGARLVDLSTGAEIAALPLAPPPLLPASSLTMPESENALRDVLGIRLGMSFADAEKLIREHMEIGNVLVADRTLQTSAATGQIEPYTSGRIFSSAEGNELIAIFDEPPAAPETVLGIWRILRLPQGSVDSAGLKAILAERYGVPGTVQEVSLPFMNTGVAYLWNDAKNPRCEPIDLGFQTDLWRDEASGAPWMPPFMTQPLFPIFTRQNSFIGTDGQPLPPSEFCPAFLGVRFATYDGRNAAEPAGDEIITWLSDNRSYAKTFLQSLLAPQAGAATQETGGAKPKVDIDF